MVSFGGAVTNFSKKKNANMGAFFGVCVRRLTRSCVASFLGSPTRTAHEEGHREGDRRPTKTPNPDSKDGWVGWLMELLSYAIKWSHMVTHLIEQA
jgi:hypothetical protein